MGSNKELKGMIRPLGRNLVYFGQSSEEYTGNMMEIDGWTGRSYLFVLPVLPLRFLSMAESNN